ncbi:flagellar hook-length control protein FliK [Microvirga sp. TS319]|uniref:flagellar hook-length control protein FliK n=1 Tax=Microvirga sp. TS319 TaxID=3241165 RepID=UPI003519FE2E
MNPFDTLSRNLPRPVDAQSAREPAVAAEGSNGKSASSDADSFSTFLQGLSDRPQRGAATSQPGDGTGAPEPAAQDNTGEVGGFDIANSVLTLLQGILPPVSGQQVSAARSDANGQQNDPSASLSLGGILQSPDENGVPSLTEAPKLMIAVRHQETHFKPVLENFETGLEAGDTVEGEASPEVLLGNDPLRKSPTPGAPDWRGPAKAMHSSNQSIPETQGLPHEKGEGEDIQSAQPIARRTSGTPELRNEGNANIAKAEDPVSLPTETLHRIASAVRSDLRAVSGSVLPQSPQGSEANHTFSIKASESALRVLHLQLHPADLGSVTIKMRLAGESLEMELHVEREETAQLLRHDSEKLSALLRGSGYRPDVISVQVTDGAVQDRAAPRPQGEMQMNGQSFQHGGAGQRGHSRDQEKPYASTRAEHHRNVEEDRGPDGDRSSGVYL